MIRPFFSLLFLVFIMGSCSGIAGFMVNLVVGAFIHPDLGLFAGCFVAVGIFYKMWKKLLGDGNSNTPGFQG